MWFKWTAPSNTILVLDASTSAIPAIVAVYWPDSSNATASGAAMVAASESGPCGGGDLDAALGDCLEYAVSAGRSYSIGLTGRRGERGAYTLKWRTRGEPPTVLQRCGVAGSCRACC